LLSLLGGKFEFTPFEGALHDTVQWLVEHYDTDARIGHTNARQGTDGGDSTEGKVQKRL